MTLASDAVTDAWTLRDQGTLWFYRVGSYVLLHVLDEPAWLALMFC